MYEPSTTVCHYDPLPADIWQTAILCSKRHPRDPALPTRARTTGNEADVTCPMCLLYLNVMHANGMKLGRTGTHRAIGAVSKLRAKIKRKLREALREAGDTR